MGEGGSLIRLRAFSLGLLRLGWGCGKGSRIKLHRADLLSFIQLSIGRPNITSDQFRVRSFKALIYVLQKIL